MCIYSTISANNNEHGVRNRFQGDIELSVDKIKQDVVPNLEGEKVEVIYKVSIYNRGVVDETYDITEYNNHGYNVEISPSRTGLLPSNNSEVITITISVDNNAPISRIDYNTTVKVISINNHTKFNSITLKTKVLQAYGVELQPRQKELKTGNEVKEGHRTVIFDVGILNLGTGNDSFKLENTEELLEYTSFSNTYFNLPDKEKADFQVIINVPWHIQTGFYNIHIRAISRGDDTNYFGGDAQHDYDLYLEVTRIYNSTLSATETIKSGAQGEIVEFGFKVTNFGNDEDMIELRLSDFDLNWPWKLQKSKYTIQDYYDTEGNEVEGSLSVEIPTGINATVGVYNVSLWVYSINTPLGDLEQNNYKPLIFQLVVDPVHHVHIVKDFPIYVSQRGVYPGKKLTHYFTLTNFGNENDTFKLEMFGDKLEWFESFKNEFSLMPFESEKFNITIKIPPFNDTNAKEIEAAHYSHRILVSSKNDPNVFDEEFISPKIKEVYKIEFESDLINRSGELDLLTIDPNARRSVTFSLTINNRGNSEVRFDLNIIENSDWSVRFMHTYGEYYLQLGESLTIPVEVTHPNNIKNNKFEKITIQVKLNNRLFSASYSFNATMLTGNIEFTDLKIVGEKTPGSTVTVKLNIRNNGEADANDVYVRFYDNNNEIYSERINKIEANNETEIKFNYDLDEGNHELRAWTEWNDEEIVENEIFTAKRPSLSWTVGLIIILVMIILTIIILSVISYTKKKNLQQQKIEDEAAKRVQKNGRQPLPKPLGTANTDSNRTNNKPSMDRNLGPKDQGNYPYPYYQYYYPPPGTGHHQKEKYPPRYPPY
jgi:hypothetical protein